MWKRLLVPHDFSECAAHALGEAVALAKVHGSSLVLLHVSPLPPNLSADALITPPGEREAVRVAEYTTRGATKDLEAIAAPLRRKGLDLGTRAIVAPSGDVAGEICNVAKEIGAEAIVVGTHGRTGLSHLLLGSVAEKIVRRATIPVVTVRMAAPEARPTREESVAEDETAG